jgi:hypothetical protein
MSQFDAFNAQMDKLNATLEQRVESLIRGVAEVAWESLVDDTPVDTPAYTDTPGVARGNWNFGVGSDDSLFSESRANPHGPVPPIPDVPFGGRDLYLTNHTPYAEVLEYGGYPVPVQKGSWNRITKSYVIKSVGGYSAQAPAGWVRLAAAQLEPLADAIVTELERQRAL